MNNTQHKLDKVRPPRVQITYDVEVGNAETSKELPLVIGVMGDFSQTDDTLRDRKFVKIDKDNFNDIMNAMSPRAEFLVDNVLTELEGQLAISLTFNSIEDFLPDSIVYKVDALKKLMEIREQLSDLKNRAASNERLKEQLLKVALEQKNDSDQGDKEE